MKWREYPSLFYNSWSRWNAVDNSMGVASLPQVINKTDLAEAVGADLKVMERDSIRMRDGGPFVFAQVPYQ